MAEDDLIPLCGHILGLRFDLFGGGGFDDVYLITQGAEGFTGLAPCWQNPPSVGEPGIRMPIRTWEGSAVLLPEAAGAEGEGVPVSWGAAEPPQAARPRSREEESRRESAFFISSTSQLEDWDLGVIEQGPSGTAGRTLKHTGKIRT